MNEYYNNVQSTSFLLLNTRKSFTLCYSIDVTILNFVILTVYSPYWSKTMILSLHYSIYLISPLKTTLFLYLHITLSNFNNYFAYTSIIFSFTFKI